MPLRHILKCHHLICDDSELNYDHNYDSDFYLRKYYDYDSYYNYNEVTEKPIHNNRSSLLFSVLALSLF